MMLKSLKTLSLQDFSTSCHFIIKDRLPFFVQGPCELTGEFRVTRTPDYYRLTSTIQGTVSITCQTCLASFHYPYYHQNELAICWDERRAEQMMASLDCIVNPSDDIDFLEIVTDDLHLFCPEKHAESEECDALICSYGDETGSE